MINVIGQGYIGLPTALMFSAHGLKVVGTDLDENKIKKLSHGELTFKEENMNEIYKKALNSGIKFSTDYQKTDFYIICVPTPYDSKSKRLDPSYVIDAVNKVLDNCDKGSIIVIESTVSPGTHDKYIKPIFKQRGVVLGEDVHLVHAPERILPGNMIYELVHNSRTIGSDEESIGQKVKEYYGSFCNGDIVVTSIKIAEMTKVVENTFRDINIAFANELAKICREDDMDVYEIIKIANMHPRVNILQPGPGVGGHCISVDPWFLVGDYPDLTNLILTARHINNSMPIHVLKRIHDIMNENDIKDFSKVGIYGLTYKENVDDTRESPSLQLLDVVKGLKSYDPYVRTDIVDSQYHDFDKFLKDVDLVVIFVNHNEIIENLDKLSDKLVLDTKNIIEKSDKVYKL